MLFNSIPVGMTDANVAFNQDVKAITSKEIDMKYLLYSLKSAEHKLLSLVVGTGIGAGKLELDDLKKLDIVIPTKDEQEKVAEFLAAVDKRIAALDKKIELLKQYKKGVMQTIFTQKLRFKDENGKLYQKWENDRLGNLCSTAKSGGTPTVTKRSYYVNGEIPFLAISDITEQGKYLTRTSKRINELGLKSSAAWLVPVSSLIYSMYASVGLVAINKIPLATSQAVINLVPDDSKIVLDYLYYYLTYYKSKIHKFIETGTQGNLNAQTVKALSVPLPHVDEQQKIADFLTALDDKIKLEESKLEQAKNLKKALLQQMFV
jgi:type I restriction enzyme S subunit